MDFHLIDIYWHNGSGNHTLWLINLGRILVKWVSIMTDYYSLPWKPTLFEGIQYASKLEARWAAFFIKLGIIASYEPRQFETPEYIYTPDFGLLGTPYQIIEIKPNMRQANGVVNQAILKLKSVSLHYRTPTALVAGNCWPGEFDIAFFKDGKNVFPDIGLINRIKCVFGLNRRESESVLVLKMLLGNHKRDYMRAFSYSREVIR